MEWAVCTACSDSEDAVTQEMDEEEGAPSSTGQQGPVCGVAEECSCKDAHGSVNLAIVKKAASTRSDWDSMDSVKAEAGEKPPYKDIQDLIHFEKKDGSKLCVSQCMLSSFTANITEDDGISDDEPEVLTMQTMDEDETQALVAQEDHGESAEELEFQSSTAEFAVSRKQNPRRSDVRRKKRNLADDGPGQASKLVKIEQPQKIQVPSASAECGGSASDPTHSQRCESFQARHLEGNRAAQEPTNCAQSTEPWSHSSELQRLEVNTGEVNYHCLENNIPRRNSVILEMPLAKPRKPYKCPVCMKHFLTEDDRSTHQRMKHSVGKPFECKKCHLPFNSMLLLDSHYLTAHGTERSFKCPNCVKHFLTEYSLRIHQRMRHSVGKPFKCKKCHLPFDSMLLLDRHQLTAHVTEKSLKCPDCKKRFLKAEDLNAHHRMKHGVDKPFKCTLCHLAFDSSILLEGHRDTVHYTEKTFKCPDCNRRFATSDSTIAHWRAKHGVDKPFKCTICHFTFDSSLLLEGHHHTTHHTEKRFKCPECNEHFFEVDCMKQHRFITHDVSDCFRCAHCAIAFNTLNELMKHQVTCTGGGVAFGAESDT